MKEHKEVTISYDKIGDNIKNIKIIGREEDLVAVLSSNDDRLFAMCMSSIMHSYLTAPCRELFLSNFFRLASDFQQQVVSKMNKDKAS